MGASGFNQVIVLGRLVSAPEQIQTKSGSLMIKATLEVSTYRRNADGQGEEIVTRIPAVMFGKLAENFERFVEIGHLVQLVGRLDGFERTGGTGDKWLTLNFLVEQLILLPNGGKSSSEAPPKAVPKPASTKSAPAKPQRDYDRAPEMKKVATNEAGEPEDVPF